MSESDGAIKPKTRFTWTAAERAEWLDLFRGSRQSAAQFCRETALPPATLSLWLNQQALSDAREAVESELVEVSFTAPTAALPAEAAAVTGPPAAGPAVTVHWPNGTRLEVNAGADVAWVGQLCRAVQPAGV